MAATELSNHMTKPYLVLRSRRRERFESLPEWPFGILYVADDHGLGREISQTDFVQPGRPARRSGTV